LRAAIAVAKQQGTRTFELRAALSLAKLYRATGRPVEAHDILAPALEGFAPTSEMTERLGRCWRPCRNPTRSRRKRRGGRD
jgi:hypothetical protein